MKKAILLLFYCFSVLLYSNAQDSTSINKSKTPVVKDYRIDKLNTAYSETYNLEGFRVQIYSGNKKQPARDARLKFTRVYRKTKAYEVYEQPYFKVRVGDFKTKMEALKFKNDLNKHFPNCFIVKDNIEFKD